MHRCEMSNPSSNSDRAQQQAILDALPMAVFLERNDRILYANAAARLSVGWPEETPSEGAPSLPLVVNLLPGLADAKDKVTLGKPQGYFRSELLPAMAGLRRVEGTYRRLAAGSDEAVIVLFPEGGEAAPMPQSVEELLLSIPEALSIVRDDKVLFVNPAFSRLFGYTAEEAEGANIIDLIVPATRRHESDLVPQTVAEQGRALIETVRKTKAGELLDVSMLAGPLIVNGAAAGLVVNYRDIGERKRAEDKMHFDALHDPLTGLANRSLFQDRLALALSRRERLRGQTCGVLFLDMDRFKEVNDTLGHAVGDMLLKEVATRLARSVRPQDTAARLGGDEFAILAENIQNPGDLQSVANRVARELEQPFTIHGHTILAPTSIGAAIASAGHQAPEALIHDADFAMYRAKRAGGARIELFDKRLEIEVANRKEREEDLRRALSHSEVELWYQPIYRLENGKLEGFESQLRWRRADGFLDGFSELGYLDEDAEISALIGRETRRAACLQLSAWAEMIPLADLTLAINVNARQFYNPSFVEQLSRALEETGASPALLLLEISESTLNERPDTARAILKRIASENLHVAVDHFGSSLAPINHLVRLPIDAVKLDPKLAATSGNSKRQAAILESLIQLGHSLGVLVVAEGIASQQQLDLLRGMGCELGQGEFLSEAVDAQNAQRLAESGAWSIQPLA